MKLKEYKYKINGMKFNVGIGDINGTSVHVEVNGIPYQVEMDSITTAAAASNVGLKVKKAESAPRTETGEKVINKPAAPTGHAEAVKCPLPGTVTQIKVKVGDTVKSGDTVMMLEAMKMENEIHCMKNGTVKQICVAIGDAVLEGADLIIVE